MKEAIINLLKIKSLVTLLTTIAFVVLVLTTGTVPQEFLIVYTSIIAFYFGVQTTKKEIGYDSAEFKEKSVQS